jgi:plasmid maintenance system antidote protein VapI
VKKDLKILKGIHPGFVLERELEKRQRRKGNFALQIQEYPQTLSTITKGKRDMNIGLALKIEHVLGIEEGFFMILQVYYDIEQEKKKQNNSQPNLSIIRSILFWDTKMEKIDWQKQKKTIIKRIFERGNEIEKKEITRFYGSETIFKNLNDAKHA